jgi:hypothetical protein
MDYWISEGYGLWVELLCIPTWSFQNSMGFWRVWVIRGMGYERVDCSPFRIVLYSVKYIVKNINRIPEIPIGLAEITRFQLE